MIRINWLVNSHPDLFTYLPAKEVYAHDRLLAKSLLRFFPISVTPNRITMFRIIATPLVFYFILYDMYVLGTISFFITAFTDALDGSVARTRNQITKFGMLFDPLADKLLIGSLVFLLVFRYFNFWLGMSILSVEFLFIILALIAKIKFKTVRMANIWGKIKMILQVGAVFLTLLALLLNFPILFSIASWFFGLAVGFAIVSLFMHGA